MLYIEFGKSFTVVNNAIETASENAAVYFKDGNCVVAPLGGLDGAVFIGRLTQTESTPVILSMGDLPD